MTNYKCPACGSGFLEQTDDKVAGIRIISCMKCGERYSYLLSEAYDKSAYQIMCKWHKDYEKQIGGEHMTNNRATELLRKLLEERGVKWRESVNVANCVFTIYESPIFGEIAAMDNGEYLYFHELNGISVTPEQAIAATLGSDRYPYEQRIRELGMEVDA